MIHNLNIDNIQDMNLNRFLIVLICLFNLMEMNFYGISTLEHCRIDQTASTGEYENLQ